MHRARVHQKLSYLSLWYLILLELVLLTWQQHSGDYCAWVVSMRLACSLLLLVFAGSSQPLECRVIQTGSPGTAWRHQTTLMQGLNLAVLCFLAMHGLPVGGQPTDWKTLLSPSDSAREAGNSGEHEWACLVADICPQQSLDCHCHNVISTNS